MRRLVYRADDGEVLDHRRYQGPATEIRVPVLKPTAHLPLGEWPLDEAGLPTLSIDYKVYRAVWLSDDAE